MPIYEYACTKCGFVKEIVCSVSGGIRPWDSHCPKCGNDKIKKVPSVPGDPRGGDTPKFYGGNGE